MLPDVWDSQLQKSSRVNAGGFFSLRLQDDRGFQFCTLYIEVEMGVRSELCVGSLDCGYFSLKIF